MTRPEGGSRLSLNNCEFSIATEPNHVLPTFYPFQAVTMNSRRR